MDMTDKAPEPDLGAKMPLALDGPGHARAWRARVEKALADADFLARQSRLYEWFDWVDSDPELSGLGSLAVDLHWLQDDMAGSDEPMGLLKLSWPGGARVEELADSSGVRRATRDGSPDHQAFVLGARARVKLHELFGEWVDHFGTEPLPMEFEAWRARLFTASEAARWEASLVEASSQDGLAPAKARRL